MIGIVPCAKARCPDPATDLGEILFVGKYEPQGITGSPINTFENFTFVVPSDISGAASIQVQHNFLTYSIVSFRSPSLFTRILANT